jgi:hypothetical protein
VQALDAEILAIKALTFLAQSPDDIDRFVTLSGVAPGDLRERAGDPEILAAVLDFILTDDSRIEAACESLGVDPQDLQAARRALPGA